MKPINLRRAAKKGKPSEFDKWAVEQLAEQLTEKKEMAVNQSDREKAEKTASLFFRQSDERPFKDSGLKWEDDRKILVYEISEALASERYRIFSDPRIQAIINLKTRFVDCKRYKVGDGICCGCSDSYFEAVKDFQELLKEASNE